MDLIKAARIGDLDKVRQLVTNGVKVNEHDEDENTALIFASSKGHSEIVVELLKHNANVNAVDKDRGTALIYASSQGHFDIVVELLKHHANVKAVDEDGDTALICASQRGYSDIVIELLKHDAKLNAAYWNGPTGCNAALYWIKLLANRAMSDARNGYEEKALLAAGKIDKINSVVHLLATEALVDARNCNGETALLAAVKNGHLSSIVHLLKYNSNVHASDHANQTPLGVAIKAKHEKIVEVLVQAMKEGFPMRSEFDHLVSINQNLIAEREAVQNALEKSIDNVSVASSGEDTQYLETLEIITQERLRWKNEKDELASVNCHLLAERDALQDALDKSMESVSVANTAYLATIENLTQEGLRMQSEKDELTSVNCSLVADKDVLQNALDKSKETVIVADSAYLEAVDKDEFTSVNYSLVEKRDDLQNALDKSKETVSVINCVKDSQSHENVENLTQEGLRLPCESVGFISVIRSLSDDHDLHQTTSDNSTDAFRIDANTKSSQIDHVAEIVMTEQSRLQTEKDASSNRRNMEEIKTTPKALEKLQKDKPFLQREFDKVASCDINLISEQEDDSNACEKRMVCESEPFPVKQKSIDEPTVTSFDDNGLESLKVPSSVDDDEKDGSSCNISEVLLQKLHPCHVDRKSERDDNLIVSEPIIWPDLTGSEEQQILGRDTSTTGM